jgi:hypothetical protein
MEAQWGRGPGGVFLKECQETKFMKPEIEDEQVQKKLWELSESTVQALEKEGALRRAKEKKADDKKEGKATATATQANGTTKQRKGK